MVYGYDSLNLHVVRPAFVLLSIWNMYHSTRFRSTFEQEVFVCQVGVKWSLYVVSASSAVVHILYLNVPTFRIHLFS